jgi:hypothetical protein
MENVDKIISKKEKNIIGEKEFFDAYPEFFKEIGPETILEDGTLVYENAELKVSLKLDEFTLEQFSTDENIQYGINKFFRTYDTNPEHYLRLTKFELINKDNNFAFDLKSEQKDPFVIVWKNQKKHEVEGQVLHKLNLIELSSNPSSPQSVLTLFHELGHLNDKEMTGDMDRLFDLRYKNIMAGGDDQKIAKEQDAILIKQERTAWAYALKKIKPAIASLDIPDESLDKFVHDFTMGSHCKSMQEDYSE